MNQFMPGASLRERLVPVMGLETEYGITRDQAERIDPVVESMSVVRAYVDGPFRREWDYGDEDPHRDARGFRVDRLEQDREEDEFAVTDAARPFSFRDMKSDLVLPNGARFYNDHTHPEYSTPECASLRDLVAHDRAGEAVLWEAARRRNRALETDGEAGDVSLYKNNTDFHGHAYGCHDNYLVARAIPFDTLAQRLIPFLVSRQIVCGAGKIGIESSDGYTRGQYQISQRADFIETDLSVNTMHNRPIVNTRDEPHADPALYRRLHLILGDANLSEYATALKVGTTRLVLELIARDAAPRIALESPVEAIKTISLDPELKAAVRRMGGGVATALELQSIYLEAAQRGASGSSDEETRWVLREWEQTLTHLPRDRALLRGRVDWITKQWLLETFVEAQRVAWDDPWLSSLDLEYHHLDPRRGLHRGLEAEGLVARFVDDAAVDVARTHGPGDTRAAIRGLCVKKYADQIQSVQWGRIVTKDKTVLDLTRLFDPDDVARLFRHLEARGQLSEAIHSWYAKHSMGGQA